ncbi:type I-F CRISPR-associated endonuclease Cas1f [Piscirickettsia litoralis]|uniref:type I-F CRISPR-associated endonuclease Cas1f n=1 Tax=Piscirickettsia litoralis TaxID=1891921 RepID=UPI001F15A556|nr:type I-F CRISPR-associated endonuclease Cas1f [Piscirickettsia litoralis]
MEQLTDLKAILHSKRANLYYLEKCRVMQKDGRILYLTEDKQGKNYWNIPIANTTVILLGVGTSITQAAVRMLAQAGVLVGFCGGGGTPLLMANEVEWMTPQNEYRPTEYLQGWLSFWFDDSKRLSAAKKLQQLRIEFLNKSWEKDSSLSSAGFYVDDCDIELALQRFQKKVDEVSSVRHLLTAEAEFAKKSV